MAVVSAAVIGVWLAFPLEAAAHYDSGWFVVGGNTDMRGQVIVATTNRDAKTAYVDSVWAGVTAVAHCTAAADVYTKIYSGATVVFSNVVHLRWDSPGFAADKSSYTYRWTGGTRLVVQRGHGSRVVVKIDAVWFSPDCASGDSKWGTATRTAYITLPSVPSAPIVTLSSSGHIACPFDQSMSLCWWDTYTWHPFADSTTRVEIVQLWTGEGWGMEEPGPSDPCAVPPGLPAPCTCHTRFLPGLAAADSAFHSLSAAGATSMKLLDEPSTGGGAFCGVVASAVNAYGRSAWVPVSGAKGEYPLTLVP
jgi:hypothetical protein